MGERSPIASWGILPVALALLTGGLIACGNQDPPGRSDLSSRLQAAWTRLEARGYGVNAVWVAVGEQREAALLVSDGETRVVVRAPEDRGVLMPPLLAVLQSPDGPVKLSLSLTCSRKVEVAGSQNHAIQRVARDSGLC